MRFALALLSSFLLLNAQIYAIPAGPESDSNSTGSVAGTYAGVLLPSDSSSSTSTTAGLGSNALGLFTLSVPSNGLGTGTVSVFSQGRAYVGTIDAFGDPDSSEVTGVINASYPYTVALPVTTITNGVSTTTYTSQSFTSNLTGSLKAQVSTESSIFSTSIARLSGEATLQISNTVNLNNGSAVIQSTQEFIVEGVQQTIGG